MFTKKLIAKSCAIALGTSLSLIAFADTGSLVVSTSAAKTKRQVVDVEIQIVTRDGNTIRTQLSDSKGEIQLKGLKPGLYEIRATKSGYRTVVEPSVRITDRKTATLKIELLPLLSEIEEMLVTSRAISSRDSLNISATRLDREALRSAPGSGSDVLRALDGLPGLVSTGEFASFTVRGRGPSDNLILVDDIPFTSVVHFNESLGSEDDIGGGGRYSIFAPNLVGDADFQPGGWGAKYSGRSGSLLNLSVAEGNSESPAFSARIDLAGPEFTYDGPSYLHEDTSILFSARKLDFGQFFDLIGIEDIGSPTLTDIIFKSKSELNNLNSLSFLAIYAPEEFTRDLDNVLVENDDGDIEDVLLIDMEQDSELYAFTWDRFIGDSGELSNKIYYRNRDKTTSQGESFPDLVPANSPKEDIPVREKIIRADELEQELGWRSDYRMDNVFGEFSTGLRVSQQDLEYASELEDDWIRYVYDQTDFRPDPSVKYITLTPEIINSSIAESAVSYGVFAEQLFILEGWSLRTGLRYDYDGFSEENLISPRLGLNWTLTPSLTFSATSGLFYQAPKFLQRTSDPENFTLENEEITQFSLGLEYLLGKDWKFIAETYYQDLDNLIVIDDRVTGESSNNGTGESYGFDTVLSKRFSDNWSSNISYSYNESKVDYNDGRGKFNSDFHRPHALSIGGVWEINERWKLSARWKFLSGRPTDSAIINENVLGDGEPLRFSKEIVGNNDERFDTFQSLNFRADYRRSAGFADIIAFIDIINLLGSENPNEASFNERTGKDTVEEGNAFPLVGLRLEF